MTEPRTTQWVKVVGIGSIVTALTIFANLATILAFFGVNRPSDSRSEPTPGIGATATETVSTIPHSPASSSSPSSSQTSSETTRQTSVSPSAASTSTPPVVKFVTMSSFEWCMQAGQESCVQGNVNRTIGGRLFSVEIASNPSSESWVTVVDSSKQKCEAVSLNFGFTDSQYTKDESAQLRLLFADKAPFAASTTSGKMGHLAVSNIGGAPFLLQVWRRGGGAGSSTVYVNGTVSCAAAY